MDARAKQAPRRPPRGALDPAAGLISALGTLLLAACGGEATPPRSILLVTLDTTRADRLGCYGRTDAGTPVLDALARDGVRFERAYTTAPITLPAHATILTGAPPPVHGLRDNGLAALDEGAVTLAEVARAAGLRTAAFVSAFPLARVFGLAQGFEVYDDDFGAGSSRPGQLRERRADATVRAANAWLAELGPDEPFFLWVHLFDPHEPYDAPEEYARRFPGDPYQAEIAFTDAMLGELLAALDASGRSDDTYVAVTADHGEALGEHGEETHALLLYEGTVRVPLILAGPGLARMETTEDGGFHASLPYFAEPVGLGDLAATLVALAGIDDGGAFRRHGGVPLVGRGVRAPERVPYFETAFPRLHYGWSELYGIVRGEWKYVEAPGARADDGSARGELHSLPLDPGERYDRADLEPERTRALAAELLALRRRFEAEARAATPHAPSAGDLEALAALGYGGLDVTASVPGVDDPTPARDPRQVAPAVGLLSAVRSLSNAGRFDEAAEALGRMEALAPGGVFLHEARGDFHLARARTGARADLERAAEEFAAATELMPGRRGLWLRRSEALERLGRLAEALECVDRALALAPPTPEFVAAREALRRRVEGSPR